jgi:hypothetical protein
MAKSRKLPLLILAAKLAHQAKPMVEDFINDHKDDLDDVKGRGAKASRKAKAGGGRAAKRLHAKLPAAKRAAKRKHRFGAVGAIIAVLVAGAAALAMRPKQDQTSDDSLD